MHVLCVCVWLCVMCGLCVRQCVGASLSCRDACRRIKEGGASDGEDVRTSRNLTSETGHGHGGHFCVWVSRREMRAHRVRRSIFSFIFTKKLVDLLAVLQA
jgi:hypothetical protein